MNQDFLLLHTEALIFCSAIPIKLEEIASCLAELIEEEISLTEVNLLVEILTNKFLTGNFAFQLVKIGGGYQFLTKPTCQESVQILLRQKSKKRLSNSALETISIIAYKQPITKGQIEQIRGVNSDYAIQKLLEKELIVMQGKAETAGRPVLYGTTEKFMDYFGINHLKELPMPKDLGEEDINEIGELANN
jgi:segregation and condensation protein B